MKNGELINLIMSEEITEINYEEIDMYNKLDKKTLEYILKIKKPFRTKVITKLKKEDFINEKNYFYILSKINELRYNANLDAFLSIVTNPILENSKNYKRIIDKLLKTNEAGIIICTKLLKDERLTKIEYIDEIILIILDSNPDILTKINKGEKYRDISSLKSFILDNNLIANKEKHLAAIKTYFINPNSNIPSIITNKKLIDLDYYIDFLKWIEKGSPEMLSELRAFLSLDYDEKDLVNTFLIKHNTLKYFIENVEEFFFSELLKKLKNKTPRVRKNIEFALKTFNQSIKKSNLFYTFMQMATGYQSEFLLHSKHYKEVIDISRRIKSHSILQSYVGLTSNYNVMHSKHWRFILTTVANTKNKITASNISTSLTNEEILKREDLRTIISTGINIENEDLQNAYFDLAPNPKLLARKDYLEIMKLTSKVSTNVINNYTNLAISSNYQNYPYLYEILLYASKINNEEIFWSYNDIVSNITKSSHLNKATLIKILTLISSETDPYMMAEYKILFNSNLVGESNVTDSEHFNFIIDTLTNEKNNPNYKNIVSFIGNKVILSLEDYESVVKKFIEIKNSTISTLISYISSLDPSAKDIKEVLEINNIYDLQIIHNILKRLKEERLGNPSFISRIIDTIKNKKGEDLYYILETLSEKHPTAIFFCSYRILCHTEVSSIPDFIDKLTEEKEPGPILNKFISTLKSKKRNAKKELLLSMLTTLNPEEDVNMTEIKNILSLTPSNNQ